MILRNNLIALPRSDSGAGFINLMELMSMSNNAIDTLSQARPKRRQLYLISDHETAI